MWLRWKFQQCDKNQLTSIFSLEQSAWVLEREGRGTGRNEELRMQQEGKWQTDGARKVARFLIWLWCFMHWKRLIYGQSNNQLFEENTQANALTDAHPSMAAMKDLPLTLPLSTSPAFAQIKQQPKNKLQSQQTQRNIICKIIRYYRTIFACQNWCCSAMSLFLVARCCCRHCHCASCCCCWSLFAVHACSYTHMNGAQLSLMPHAPIVYMPVLPVLVSL